MEKKRGLKIGRGEIAISTLIGITIAVLGFVVLLVFFISYSGILTGNIDREVCHQSVIYRATLPTTGGVNQYVPLKCKTLKFCITTGLIWGECKEFKNAKGVGTVRVSDGDKGKQQIEKFITQEMISCWSMMGEGKVEVFGDWLVNYGVKGVGSSCVVCSRIAFDKDRLGKAGVRVDEINIFNYMNTNKFPEKDLTYFEYFSSQNGKMTFNRPSTIFPIIDIDSLEVDKEGKLILPPDIAPEQLFLDSVPPQKEVNQIGVMFMQIAAPTNGEVFKNYLGALEISSFGSFVLAPSVTAVVFKNPVTLAILAAFGVYQQTVASANNAVSMGYCGDVESSKEARTGCSVVRMVDYGKEDLKKYCSIVESIP